MRIAYITAGAGKMYCGSCLRDNALAKALMDLGHDVLLIPTYTPSRTDEKDVSLRRVFLGGVNVYLQQRFPIFRNSPPFLDRLLDARPLLKFLSGLGISVDPEDLGKLTVAMLHGRDGSLRKEILRLVRFLAEISPDVVNLPNSLMISLAPAIKAEIRVPVCCTLQGEDLFLGMLQEPYRAESLKLIREHAGAIDAFIAVSRYGARSMAELLGIDPGRIRVAPLGINLDGFHVRRGLGPELFTIGYLARLAPEKGLRFLCQAYRILRSRIPAARLSAAGYLPPEHKSFFAGITAELESVGLSAEFHYHGEIDRRQKVDFLHGLSVLSVPEYYRDPKGLFLLEAMAAGIPVVQPRQGAFTEIIETTGGGVLFEPGEPEHLAEALYGLWKDPARMAELGRRGAEGVRVHYSATRMAEQTAEIYQSLRPKTIREAP